MTLFQNFWRLGSADHEHRDSSRNGSSSSVISADVPETNNNHSKDFNGGDSYSSAHDYGVSCYSPPSFPMERFRLVLFLWDSNDRKRVLFDSKVVKLKTATAAQPQPPPSPRAACNGTEPKRMPSVSPCGKYVFVKPPSDTKLLGEMIFGTIKMAFAGESFKLHQLHSQKQLMLTRLFARPKTTTNSRVCHPTISFSEDSSDSDSQYSTIRSMDGWFGRQNSTRSIPMDVPDVLYKSPPASYDSEGSSISGTEDRLGGIGPQRSKSTGLISPRPRVKNNSISSSCIRSWASRFVKPSSFAEPRRRGISRVFNDLSDEEARNSNVNARSQVGMAVIFDLKKDSKSCGSAELFERFVLGHVHFLTLEQKRLQIEIKRAFLDQKGFLDIVYTAWQTFCDNAMRLYASPRLAHPVWLSGVGPTDGAPNASECPSTGRFPRRRSDETLIDNWELEESHSTDPVSCFVNTFYELANVCDTKERQYFLSRLLTVTLKHHLTWVGSVASEASSAPNTPILTNTEHRLQEERCKSDSCCNSSSPTTQSASLHTRSQSDPKWTQLSEISGSLGFPVHRAKTLIVGKNRELVQRLLYLLTYFLRSSDVREAPPASVADPDNSEDDKSTLVSRDPPLRFERCARSRVAADSTVSAATTKRGRRRSMGEFVREQRRKAQTVTQSAAHQVPCSWSTSALPINPPAAPFGRFSVKQVEETAVDGWLPKSFSCKEFASDVTISDESCAQLQTTSLHANEMLVGQAYKPLYAPVNGLVKARQRVSPDGPRHKMSKDSGYDDVHTLLTGPHDVAPSEPPHKESKDSGFEDSPGRQTDFEIPSGAPLTSLRSASRAQSPNNVQFFLPPVSQKSSTSEEPSSTLLDCTITAESDSSAHSLVVECGSANVNRRELLARSKEQGTLDSGIFDEIECARLLEHHLSERRCSKHLQHERRLAELLADTVAEKICTPKATRTFDRPVECRLNEQDCVLNMGRSLLAGMCEDFCPHFTLSGLQLDASRSVVDVSTHVRDELRLISGLETIAGEVNCMSASITSELEEKLVAESPYICVLANTDDWSVKVLSNDDAQYKLKDMVCTVPAHCVADMVENLKMLHEIDSAPNFVMAHLEDSLTDIYARSGTLAHALSASQSERNDVDQLTRTTGCDWSDVPLLLAVAAIHSPEVVSDLRMTDPPKSTGSQGKMQSITTQCIG